MGATKARSLNRNRRWREVGERDLFHLEFLGTVI